MKHVFKLIIFVACLSVASGAWATTSLAIGDALPDYLGKDQDGNEIHLSDNKGKVVIISFWASWCKPCLKELPVLESIQNKLGTDTIKVVAINYKESRSQFNAIKRKLSELSLTLGHDRRGLLGEKFGVEGIPHLFIVGKDGTLAYQNVGYGDAVVDKLVVALNNILSS